MWRWGGGAKTKSQEVKKGGWGVKERWKRKGGRYGIGNMKLPTVTLSRNIWTPEMYGLPLKYLDHVRSTCCLRVVKVGTNNRVDAKKLLS